MALMSDFPTFASVSDDARRAWSAPLGAVSPLWLAFGAAATAGVAYWWLSQWTRPVNVEAIAIEIAPAVVPIQIEPEAPEAIEAEPVIASSAEPVLEADDLTLLKGVGPKLAAALAERGVTRFVQIAAWSEAEVAEVDAVLKLLGRPQRDGWVAQAAKLSTLS